MKIPSLTLWSIPISALGLTTNQKRMEFNVTGDGVTTETWPGAGTLQASESLAAGSWTNVTGAVSGYTVPTSETKLFFRLMQ